MVRYAPGTVSGRAGARSASPTARRSGGLCSFCLICDAARLAASSGQLINLAQQSGYELLVTCDQGIRYQQNPATIRIAILVLIPSNWRVPRSQVDVITAAVNNIKPGEYRAIATC